MHTAAVDQPTSSGPEHTDRQRRMANLDRWLDELDAEHGPPSAAAVAAAEAWFRSTTPLT